MCGVREREELGESCFLTKVTGRTAGDPEEAHAVFSAVVLSLRCCGMSRGKAFSSGPHLSLPRLD